MPAPVYKPYGDAYEYEYEYEYAYAAGQLKHVPRPTDTSSQSPQELSHSTRPRRRPNLRLYEPLVGRYNTRGYASSSAAAVSPSLLPQPILDMDEDDTFRFPTPTEVDRCETTPSTWPRQRAPLADAAGVGARDKRRRLEGIAQVIARSCVGASEREILQFLLSESDDEEDEIGEGGGDMDVEDDSGGEEGNGDAGEDEDEDDDEEEMEMDEDEDEEDNEEQQELRTLYRYMNPSKYGHVDLAHPLCSPIEELFGKKKPRGFFDDEFNFDAPL